MDLIDCRLLKRRIDVLEDRIRPLEETITPRMRKAKRAKVMKEIQALHHEQLGCIRRIDQILSGKGSLEPGTTTAKG